MVTLNPPDNMMLTADQSHMASASAVSDEHSSKSLIAPMALTDRKRDADIDEKHEEVQEYGKDNVDEYEEDLEYVEDDEEDQDYVEEKEEDLDYVEEKEEDVEYVEESDEGLEYVEENDEGLEYVEENEEYVEEDMEFVEEFSGSVVTPMAMTRKQTRIIEEYDEDKEGFANSPMSGGMMENDSDLEECGPRKGRAPRRGAWRRSRPLSPEWPAAAPVLAVSKTCAWVSEVEARR